VNIRLFAEAEYGGFIDQALGMTDKVKTDIVSSEDYTSYVQKRIANLYVRGGDQDLAAYINSHPSASDIPDKLKQWEPTWKTHMDMIGVQWTPWWDLMPYSAKDDVRGRQNDFRQAFLWLSQNPDEHWTKCRITINSDWGVFGLASAGARIYVDSDMEKSNKPISNLTITDAKIAWGEPGSHKFQLSIEIR
jgi:hypothetical protein